MVITCLPYTDLPIREERISGRILKIVNTLGNVKNVTVTIFATSITNMLFMIIGTKTVQFVVFLLKSIVLLFQESE